MIPIKLRNPDTLQTDTSLYFFISLKTNHGIDEVISEICDKVLDMQYEVALREKEKSIMKYVSLYTSSTE